MKAIAAYKGKAVITEIDRPSLAPGHVRIRTEYSAVSPGTEMTMMKNSKDNDQPVVIGYSAVGIVTEIGEQVKGIEIGQRVACYGGPYVRHAEELAVPSNLTARVPAEVSAEEAAFAGLGAIAIHALRVADLRFGESAVVVGLGILGQIIAQISSAAANVVLGYDLNKERVESLKPYVAHAFDRQEDLEQRIQDLTGGRGTDSVILCAGGPGEELINSSMTWIRDKGKIVIVGDLTMNFARYLMFGKEAQVLISRAGGPGRYDKEYELENKDYPIGFVRWTEGRNTAEYIRLLAEKRIDMKPFISRVATLDEVQDVYDNYGPGSKVMGTIFKYDVK